MRRPGIRLGAVALVLALAASACGGSGTPRAEPSTPGATSPSTSAPSPKKGSVSPGPTVTGTPRKTTPTAAPGSPTPEPPSNVVVTLDRACVRRGVASDVQGITVHTDPGYPAGYVTEYSDGSTIVGHPEYQSGGQGSGFADASGVWRQTWVVPKEAPLGKAIVHVNAGTVDPPKIPFTIVGQNKQCP